MKMKNTIKIVAVMLALVTMVVVASCAPKVAPTAPEKPGKVQIRVTWLIDLTGAYGGVELLCGRAWVTTWDYLNQKEYIPGVEVIATLIDCGSATPRAISNYKLAMEASPKPVVLHTMNSGHEVALKAQFDRDRMPNLTAGAAPDTLLPIGYIFSYISPYVDWTARYLEWAKSVWKQSRAPRFGFLTWDIAFGRAPVTDATINYAKSLGFEYVGAEFFPVAVTEASSQLLKLKALGTDFVYTNTLPSQYAAVLKSANALGMTPTSPMQLGACGWAVHTHTLISLVGNMADGVVRAHTFVPDDELRNIPTLMEVFKFGSHPPEEFGSEWATGYLQAYIIADALKAAVAKVGAQNVTNDVVYEVMQNLKTDGGGVVPGLTYSKDNHWAKFAGVQRVTVKGTLPPSKIDWDILDVVGPMQETPNLMMGGVKK